MLRQWEAYFFPCKIFFKMKSDIVFSSDIISSVSRKLNIPEKKVKHVFDFIFWFIKRKAREPDVFSFNLPHIGRLYLSTERLKKASIDKEIKDHVSKKQRVGHRNSKSKVEAFEKMFAEKSGGKYLRTVHKKSLNLNNYFFTKGLSLKELEISQNGYQK